MGGDGLAEHWSVRCEAAQTAVIVPDGCRDLIVRLRDDAAPVQSWFALADTAVTVALDGGQTLHGFRLLPGTRFRRPGFEERSAALGFDPAVIEAALREEVVRSAAIAEALESLAGGTGRIGDHARAVGLGERSLHRLVIGETGRRPGFWLQLARVRRAARAVVGGGAPLAEVAAAAGYADQAHMSRAVRHWFGCSPTRLAAIAGIEAALAAPAFG
mgnify:CR=1 FL=1